jgi:uncharacterized protein (DUF1800 family)
MNTPKLSSGLKRYKGKWTTDEARHLLKRTMFGATRADTLAMAGLSAQKAVDTIIDAPLPEPTLPLHAFNDTNYTDPDVPQGETWVNSNKQDGQQSSKRRLSLRCWWVGNMLNQNTSVYEKMVLFWHNHFATELDIVGNPVWTYKHLLIIRQHALGNFKNFVRDITYSPAMLKYLNGINNVKKAPDENYGRELQELFTIGKGPGSKYTEDDVKAAARVLTGIRVDTKVLSQVKGMFDPNRHDPSDKTFSAFYNNTVIKGRSGADGAQELDDMLDMIFAQQEVALFICRKLYRYFVYHNIDEFTEKNIIAPLAVTFRKSNYEIKPVLKQLLGSKHFFDAGNRGCLIKSPLEMMIGLCREYNILLPDNTDIVAQYNCWRLFSEQSQLLQQYIADPPNVAGWPAYYQQPLFDKMWINSDTLPKRNMFTDKMITTGFSRLNKSKVFIDVAAFTKTLANPANPDELINESVSLLYMMDLPPKEKMYIKESILLSGLQGEKSDHYWTDAWNKFIADQSDAANKKDVINKLKKLYQYLMNLPQYQLC